MHVVFMGRALKADIPRDGDFRGERALSRRFAGVADRVSAGLATESAGDERPDRLDVGTRNRNRDTASRARGGHHIERPRADISARLLLSSAADASEPPFSAVSRSACLEGAT
ncbi:MAG TPA: hypothetical protein VHB97_26020 [Polyangia bacterium]|nr:hypothetical protein [Polyangia bacterium]